MVLHDGMGAIIFSGCRSLSSWVDALEVELSGCREGTVFALQWTTLPIVVETECLGANNLISKGHAYRLRYTMMVDTILRSLQEGRKVKITHVKRDQNVVSHFLGNFCRCEKQTALWIRSGFGVVLVDCPLIE